MRKVETVTVRKGLHYYWRQPKKRRHKIRTDQGCQLYMCSYNMPKVYYRLSCTRASSIEAANKNVETPGPSNETRNLRSEGESFDFKTHCLLCVEEAKPPDVKLPSAQVPMHWRRSIHNVETTHAQNKIHELIQLRDDEWASIVHKRIVNVIDMFAAECRYHLDRYN